MCGICGIVDQDHDKVIEPSRLLVMRDAMKHRGPDDAGIWRAPGIGLGHRRLSILDVSSAGNQPMLSDDQNYVITFNGEIYNFLNLRAELQKDGLRFHSRTDTEVLLKGFQRWGLEKLLAKLVGIFAFAVWNQEERELVLVRDHFGVKPLHWSLSGREFLFASEIKALFAAGIERKIDPEYLDELLMFRFVAGPNPPFRGIHRLLPGHYLTWKNGIIREVEYYSILNHLSQDAVRPREWYECFLQSVRKQKISDVPLGTLLSGGLDSSAVTAELARDIGPGLQTFTISAESGIDEAVYAKQVANRWQCEGYSLRIQSNGVLRQFSDAQRYLDEPLAHANDLYLLAISRLAQQHVKVLLSGEGADETLAGYIRYKPLQFPRSVSLLLTPLGTPFRLGCGLLDGRVGKFSRFLSLADINEYILFNSADVLPSDLQRVGRQADVNLGWRRRILKKISQRAGSPLQTLMLYDIHTFLVSLLDRNDRMTMAASIECRVPFLDHQLVEMAFRIREEELFARGRGKHPLRRAMNGILPQQVLSRPKWGFGVPIFFYLRSKTDCRHFLEGIPNSELGNALKIPNLDRLISDFLNGDDIFMHLIRQIFFIGLWWESNILHKASPSRSRSH